MDAILETKQRAESLLKEAHEIGLVPFQENTSLLGQIADRLTETREIDEPKLEAIQSSLSSQPAALDARCETVVPSELK